MSSKIPLFIVFGFLYVSHVDAQTTKPEVFASGGKSGTAGTALVAYTIGEAMMHQFGTTNLILTQGFHQPINGFSGIAENFNVSVQVFPNPTADEVHVVLPENIGTYTISIFNQEGKLVRSVSADESTQVISLKEQAAASYFLQISGQSFNNQYTIIKTQ